MVKKTKKKKQQCSKSKFLGCTIFNSVGAGVDFLIATIYIINIKCFLLDFKLGLLSQSHGTSRFWVELKRIKIFFFTV